MRSAEWPRVSVNASDAVRQKLSDTRAAFSSMETIELLSGTIGSMSMQRLHSMYYAG